jgi:hypothetical protein
LYLFGDDYQEQTQLPNLKKVLQSFDQKRNRSGATIIFSAVPGLPFGYALGASSRSSDPRMPLSGTYLLLLSCSTVHLFSASGSSSIYGLQQQFAIRYTRYAIRKNQSNAQVPAHKNRIF